MEQTATQQKHPEDLHGLIELLREKEALVKALKRKIEHLEFVLTERSNATKNRYTELQKHFESMKNKIMLIFVDLPAGVGLNYSEIYKEFRHRFPSIPTQNLNRRIRELVSEGKLWASQDPETGKAQFYLKLKR